MIKVVFYSFIIIALTGFKAPEEKVNWVTLDEAQQMVKENPRAIFIDFTAEWCGWCKVMDKNTFSDAEVATFMNEQFYAVKLDYDSSKKLDFFGEKLTARELGTKYKVPGLPTILLLSHDSKKSKTLAGYKKPEPFLKGLKSFIDK